MAVYCHLLVCASNATERGRTQSFNCEDVASALDIETEQVASIVDAMEERVLSDGTLMGWEKRQVAREDGAAERAKAWRDAKKSEKQTPANATERTVSATERKRSADKEEIKIKSNTEAKASSAFAPPDWVPVESWADFVKVRKAMRGVPFTEAAAKGVVAELDKLRDAGHNPVDMLQNAVTNGWRTVYPPKSAQHGQLPQRHAAAARTIFGDQQRTVDV